MGGKVMIDGEVIKKMPASLKDFFHVVIPSGGGGSDFPGEEVNVLGNHVGEWSGRLNWRLRQDLGLSAYYLHFFDDHSMMFFDYVRHDGLFGLELTLPSNPVVGKVVYEYLYMKDQSGPFLWDHTSDLPEQVSGDDDYYNNHLYAGWEHRGMGIGNPLIISPVRNGDNSLKFKCNRVVSHHVGLAGHPLSWLGGACWHRTPGDGVAIKCLTRLLKTMSTYWPKLPAPRHDSKDGALLRP